MKKTSMPICGLLAILTMFSILLDTLGRLAKDIILMKEIDANKHDNQLINGLNTTIENICDILGPPFASLIIVAFGTISALYFDAITFLTVALSLMILKKHFKSRIDTVSRAIIQPWPYFIEGVKYIKKQRSVLSILFVSAIINIAITPFTFVYLPFINKNVFNSIISLGLSMCFFGTGTSLSSLL